MGSLSPARSGDECEAAPARSERLLRDGLRTGRNSRISSTSSQSAAPQAERDSDAARHTVMVP